MDRDWILLTKERKRRFAKATWVPLRSSRTVTDGSDVTEVGHVEHTFALGSAAFPKEKRELAEKLGWNGLGTGHQVLPYAYEDGYYSSIDIRQYNDKDPIGVELIFDHPQPVVGGNRWIINPDLIVALRLVKEGNAWVRPEEDFSIFIKEEMDDRGHLEISIRRDALLDYLAARGLDLRISYYMQRVENVLSIVGTAYDSLTEEEGDKDDGQFALRIREMNDIWGGSWALFRSWRNDVDEDEDVPILGSENDDNTEAESRTGERGGYTGVRVEGEFWREEWIDHDGKSPRVRGDSEESLPEFIVDTDGKRMRSQDLNNENVGRWLWFRPGVVNELLGHRGFSLRWYTEDTGGLHSTSGYKTHFGLNGDDYLTVYASDIARLPSWEQRIWVAYNVVPDGKVAKELLAAQVKTDPAATTAPEEKLFRTMRAIDDGFKKEFGLPLFTHDLEYEDLSSKISRFKATDQPALLTLAKELTRMFTDRLNVKSLRKLTSTTDEKLRSNKLLELLLSQKTNKDDAHKVFEAVAGTYDLRIGDAHPTSASIEESLALAGVDSSQSSLKQGKQLINNFGRSIYWIGRGLFARSPRQ